ncbi:alpha/beta fold hydrolase [Solirubrobacter ginsenosidimutans]|uniref:Alpha/beta fold hydrolase n=1 Tax=Solirubrobacter ginsenosidimutans TaxID=490573 RepID=A0A9X3RYH7_9ACTN|nr:alpha/beta hydrolase [Solirubrobacter ginsenosidimutans]MDA0159645.1 alpha/beta fold hydrolase [Solirubrobacter ginsenosidimutans]
MAESTCRVGELDIAYETFGDPGDPAMLLIMGLGTQMVAYHDEFCAELAGRGYFVIRHDNRDIGRSTHLDGAPTPSLVQLARRDRRAAAYTLADMASDSVGVLDCLGVQKAHIVGTSMGGMIAQTIAIRYPERTLSLVSIMSNTGGFFNGQPALTMYAVLLRPSPRDREGFINHAVAMFTKIGGSGYGPDVEDLRHIAELSYDRGHDAAGSQRQLAAIIADRDRSAELRKLAVPATVIHGAEDKLVRPSGGRATAKAIPGARLVMIDGMGHGLPRGAWPKLIGAIVDTADRAGVPSPAAG